jgi:hypothetical protein
VRDHSPENVERDPGPKEYSVPGYVAVARFLPIRKGIAWGEVRGRGLKQSKVTGFRVALDRGANTCVDVPRHCCTGDGSTNAPLRIPEFEEQWRGEARHRRPGLDSARAKATDCRAIIRLLVEALETQPLNPFQLTIPSARKPHTRTPWR